MKNKVSINIGGFEKAFKYDTYIPKLKSIGFDALDVSLCLDWNKPNPIFKTDEYKKWALKYRKVCDEYKILVNQTHALFPIEKFDFNWLITEFKKEIEATSLLGAKYIVVHPGLYSIEEKGRKKNFELNLKFFKAIEPFLKQFDVICCIENLWEFNKDKVIVKTNLSYPRELLELISELNSKYFGICLDSGHMNNVNYPVDKAIKDLGKYIKCVHFHDNHKYVDAHLLPMFGDLDWKNIIKSLKNVKYEGCLNLELASFNSVGKYEKKLMWEFSEFALNIAKTLLKMEE